jgi:hypothetical protein
VIVVKHGKNPAQLTDEDKETINQILLMCGAELSRFLDSHPDPRKNYKKMKRYTQSRKNIAIVAEKID